MSTTPEIRWRLFAKSVEARYLQLLLGEEACAFPEDGYHGDDIRALAAVFLERYGDKYVSADPAERLAVIKDFGLQYNIEKMKADLERYGIRYDQWFRESSLHESGYVKDTVQQLIDSGHTYEKDGALWFKVTDFGGEKDEVLLRASGVYTISPWTWPTTGISSWSALRQGDRRLGRGPSRSRNPLKASLRRSGLTAAAWIFSSCSWSASCGKARRSRCQSAAER
jgi:hypothetical protein